MAERPTFPEHLTNGPQRNGTNGVYYPTQADAEAEEISLHEVLEILFKNKWIILACFVAILAGTAAYTLKQDPEYEAASTVYVNNQQSNPQLGELLGLETSNRNINNEIEIIKSRRVALRVADQVIDIERVPGTDRRLTVLPASAQDVPPSRVKVAERLQKRISVRPLSRDVDIIELRVTSTIPEEAALISTVYAEEYVDYNRELSRSHLTASREFFDEVTDQYRLELQHAEDDLTQFLNRERVVAPDEEARQQITQVADLEKQQYQTRLELSTAQVEIREIEAQINRLRPGLAGQIAAGDNLVISRLREEIASLQVKIDLKYARNPELRDDPSQDQALVNDLKAITALRSELDTRSQSMAASGGGQSADSRLQTLDRLQQKVMEKKIEQQALEGRLNLIQGQLRQAEGRLNVIPRNEEIRRGLERSRQTMETLFIALIEKQEEARIAEQSELGYVDLLDEAILPGGPVRPRVHLNLIIGAILGLMVGFGLAFGRNAVDNKVRKPEDLRKRGHSVVGLIPNMERAIRQDFKGKSYVTVDGHEYSTRLIALLNPLSPVAEGYRRVRTNLQFSRPDADVRTIMVTSPSPSEGKTVTALNLAITMAQAGRRTLYVDADLRRPQAHRMMGIPREAGLVDLLFDAIPDDVEQFATDLDEYLYVMPAGRDVPNPAEVLGSRKMLKLLARWREAFDVVIVDTPPTLLVADALILAAQCDATLVVCAAGETNWQAMERCTEALGSVGADLLGVLLNRFDAKAAYGGYKYGYGYGYEYGYGNYYYGQGRKRRSRLGREA